MQITKITELDGKSHIALLDTSSISFIEVREQRRGIRQRHSWILTEMKRVFFQQKIPQHMKRWSRRLWILDMRLSVRREWMR